MATLVKFRKYDRMFNDTPESQLIFAYFPQLTYNKRLYGNEIKTCYDHVGQHSSCHKNYGKAVPATENEYQDLKKELESLGYDLKVCK